MQAHGYYTGDSVFQKDGKKLWRMFEDEKGLYLESLKTGETSRIFLEKDLVGLTESVAKLAKKIEELEALLNARQ